MPISSKIRKILLIITIGIFLLSLTAGVSVWLELTHELPIKHAHIDGSDFSTIMTLTVGFTAWILALLITIAINTISVIIWSIYGITLLVITLIHYCKSKQTKEVKYDESLP